MPSSGLTLGLANDLYVRKGQQLYLLEDPDDVAGLDQGLADLLVVLEAAGVVYTGYTEAADWATRVTGNGGTYTDAQWAAVEALVAGLKADRVWSGVNRLSVFAGEDLAAALVPIRVGTGSATDASSNFTGADFSPTAGLTGNGVNKRLSTGLTPGAGNGGLAIYPTSAIGGGGTRIPIGATGNSVITRIQQIATPAINARWRDSGDLPFAGETTMGVGSYITSRTSDTDFRVYRAGTQVGLRTGAQTAGTPNQPIYVFAYNSSGTASSFTAITLGGYSIHNGLTPAQVLALHTRLNAAMTALGRQA